MGALDFTANVIGSLAWPVVVAILIAVLHRQLKRAVDAVVDLIPGIKEISAAGVNVKLENEVRAIVGRTESLADEATPKSVSTDEGRKVTPETIAGPESGAPSESTSHVEETEPGREIPPTDHSAVVPFETELDRILRYRQLAIEAPNAAILAAFSELEGFVRRNYVVYFDAPRGQYISFVKMVTAMAREGIISDDAAQVLRELSNVRNEVSHTAAQSSAEAATTYVQGVANVVDYLIGRFEQWANSSEH